MFTVLCRNAHSDWQSTVAFFMLQESLILCKHGNISLSLSFKENTFQPFYYKHIIAIPTNKGAKSYKLKISKIGNTDTSMG